jgi:hypothetical protein
VTIGRASKRLAEDGGAVTVFVALVFPLVLLFGALAIDASHWWVISRHMQTQADAAALAAGTQFGVDPLHCADLKITNRAKQYGGVSATVPGEPAAQRYNGAEDVGSPTNEFEPNFRFNSATFASGGSTDPDAPSFVGIDPCLSGIADVKLSTTNVPWFLSSTGLVNQINAQARVQLLTVQQPKDAAPFGLETTDYKRVWVELVDLNDASATPTPIPLFKDDGTQMAGFDLKLIGPDGRGLTTWANTANYSLRSSTAGLRIGVRVRASNAASTVLCSSTAVRCFGTGRIGVDPDKQQNSLSTVRFYADPNAAGATGVRLGAVESTVLPSNPPCTDVPGVTTAIEGGFFSSSCNSVRVTAHIAGLTPSLPSAQQPVIKVTTPAGTATLDYVAGSDPGGDPRWQGNVPITVASGPNEMTVAWEQQGGTITSSASPTSCTTAASNPCKGTFKNAHRTFAANPAKVSCSPTCPVSATGAIKDLDVTVGTGAGQDSNNVRAGTCSAASPCPVTVSVGTSGSIRVSKPTDPPIVLRSDSSGSGTGLLDCDPAAGVSTQEEVANGCPANYRINDGQDCSVFANVNQLLASTPPWYCAGTENGGKGPRIADGLNQRVLCKPFPGNCTGFGNPTNCLATNHWPTFDNNDPRIIQVFLVETGASALSGNTVYPVLGFAAFYLTGWSGSPCTGADNDLPAAFAGEKGTFVGHWIDYRPPNDDNNNASGPCDISSPDVCVPILVK